MNWGILSPKIPLPYTMKSKNEKNLEYKRTHSKRKYLIKSIFLFSILLIVTTNVSASDVSVWQGQYFIGNQFQQGTFEFNFTIYDSKTNGNVCYSNITDLTTGTFGEWKTEQFSIGVNCNNASANYFLEIKIDDSLQGERRRLTMWDYLRGDTNIIVIPGNFTADSGFFSSLGSLANRITNLFARDIEVSNNVNVTNNLTAKYLIGDGRYINGFLKEIFYEADVSVNTGTFRVRSVGSAGNQNFNIIIPEDFSSLESATAVGIVGAGASGTGKDIDLNSNCGKKDQLYNSRLESDTSSTYTIPATNTLFELDISNVLSNISQGDYCGINVDHNGIGGAINYLGLKLRYRN